jgi:hypothetical protein
VRTQERIQVKDEEVDSQQDAYLSGIMYGGSMQLNLPVPRIEK